MFHFKKCCVLCNSFYDATKYHVLKPSGAIINVSLNDFQIYITLRKTWFFYNEAHL